MTSNALRMHKEIFDNPERFEEMRVEAARKYIDAREAEQETWNQRGILTEHGVYFALKEIVRQINEQCMLPVSDEVIKGSIGIYCGNCSRKVVIDDSRQDALAKIQPFIQNCRVRVEEGIVIGSHVAVDHIVVDIRMDGPDADSFVLSPSKLILTRDIFRTLCRIYADHGATMELVNEKSEWPQVKIPLRKTI